MAYDDYSMGGYIPGDYETEEQRRRRLLEEQAQAQAQDQENGISQQPGASRGVNLGDLASQYLGKRVDQMGQRVNDVTNAVTNPQQAIEQRLGVPSTTPDAGNTEVQSQQVKTYADGSQEHIVKTQTPAPAPVAVAPTPIAPQPAMAPAPQPQPQQVQQQVQQAPAQGMAAQMAPSGPAVPTVEREAEPGTPQMSALPQAGPGVQVAGPVNPATATQPGPVIQQAPAGAPGASLAQVGQVAETSEDRARQAVIDAHNLTDPEKRRQAMANILATGDEASKRLAHSFIAEDYLNQKNLRDAEKKIETATPTELARYMKERAKEGSYVKAILFARLGLTDLAKREQDMINPELKMDTTTVGTDKYTVVRDPQGGVVKAFDVNGQEVGQKTLARISAAALPTKAHLLPSAHGTPVTNANGEMGQMMYDPQTSSTYVQVGNERRPTTGWTTMAQAPIAVYNAAGARQQGTQAAETNRPQGPLPPMSAASIADSLQLSQPIISGTRPTAQQQAIWDESVAAGRPGKTAQGNPIARPGTSAHENANAIDFPTSRATAEDLRKLREAGFVQTVPQRDPNHWERLGNIPVPNGAGPQGANESYAQYKERLKREGAISEAAAKENIQVAGKRSESFNKILDEEVRPQAQAGDEISSLRKQQFKLFDRPGVDSSKIFGIANGSGQSPSDQRWTMFRDVVLGKVSVPDDKLRERAAALGLNRDEQTALAEYNNMNATINARTLKSTAGPGSVSDAEQQANRERNVDPTKVPALGAYNSMAQSQFNADLARYKGDWAPNSTASNALQLDKEWRKEQKKLVDTYTTISKDRLDYITKNGSTAAAVKQGYVRFPVPEYDPTQERWIKTKPITSYDR